MIEMLEKLVDMSKDIILIDIISLLVLVTVFVLVLAVTLKRRKKKSKNVAKKYKVLNKNLDKMASYLSQHIVSVLTAWILAIIFVPIIIYLFKIAIDVFLSINITTDKALDYWGVIVSGIPTILISLISLWQSNRALEKDDERRRNNIRPTFFIEVKEPKDKMFKLNIKNVSEHKALRLEIFNSELADIINGNLDIEKVISLDKNICESDHIVCDETLCELNDKGYPTEIDLRYYDIDGNEYSEQYKCRSDFKYLLKSSEIIEYAHI